MFSSLLILIALTSEMDPLSSAVESYKGVENYKVTLRSKSTESAEIIRYYYKRPGWVRMEFVKPHKGAVLVYDPLKKRGKLMPFPMLNSFVLNLSPESSLIRSPTGHRVDRSDIGALLITARSLQKKGRTDVLGSELVGGRPTQLISVEGEGDIAVEGIHRFLLWLDEKTYLPLKASSYDIKGDLIEEVLMDDLEINLMMEETLFDP